MMNTIQNILARAEQNCKSRGTRLTPKRKQVLQSLLMANKALSAYEVIAHCEERFACSLQAMSVYRILDFLQSENLVHKLSAANKYVACTHIGCEHAHTVPLFLVCTECQNFKEITVQSEVLLSLEDKVAQAGFHVDTPQLELECVCTACR